MKVNTKGCTKGPKNIRKPHGTPYESPTKALRKPPYRMHVLRSAHDSPLLYTLSYPLSYTLLPFRTLFVPLSYTLSLSFFDMFW